MTKDEIVQQKKNEALNKIRKIFHPLNSNGYDEYSEDSRAEQREYMVRYIIESLEKELESLKTKNHVSKEKTSILPLCYYCWGWGVLGTD